MEDGEIDDYLASQQPEQFTEATLTDLQLLREEIIEIRRNRYAHSLQEHELGVSAIATPMFDHEGRAVAVMSLCGPLDQVTSITDRATRLLLEATQSVSATLGNQI